MQEQDMRSLPSSVALEAQSYRIGRACFSSLRHALIRLWILSYEGAV